MGFHRSILQLEDEKGHSLPLSPKIPKTVKHVDGSNPLGRGQDLERNPSQTRKVRRPIGISSQQAAKRKIPPTANTQKARRPEMGWHNDPNSKTGQSPDGETPSKAKRDRRPAKMNTNPKAKQKRMVIWRGKT